MLRGNLGDAWADAGRNANGQAFDQGERDGAGVDAGPSTPANGMPTYLGNNMYLHPAPGVDPHHVVGKPHADRARQFVPFMALKGYQDLVKEAEVVPEQRWALTDADRRELQEQILGLQRGQLVRVAFYAGDHYRYVCDRVRQVDQTLHMLRLENAAVPFSQIDQVTTGD